MTTALVIGLVLVAWVVLPIPLAVLVGRWMRAGGVVLAAEVPAEAGTGVDLAPI